MCSLSVIIYKKPNIFTFIHTFNKNGFAHHFSFQINNLKLKLKKMVEMISLLICPRVIYLY